MKVMEINGEAVSPETSNEIINQTSKAPNTKLAEKSATMIMEVIPLVMRKLRTEMRMYRPADLSIPQFRALNFVRRNPGTSLSRVADHLGLTLPSVSKLIDTLQERELLKREIDAENRRKVRLTLTASGQVALEATLQITMNHLTATVSQLSKEDQLTVEKAMQILRPLFTSEVTALLPDAAEDEVAVGDIES
ncbi:MAG TPA: MarR family transcriptional regulator [Chloroflexia bacterium]|nr:MarR family transcriptional regulator [Chloroflexia bacterium]